MGKMWERCSLIEKILVSLSCAFFASAIVFLVYFESLFNKVKIHPDDKIAEVVSADQQVRRRTPMSFEFDEVKQGDVIGNGDSIFSGENSKIMVKFLKGSQLVIGEQSLVVLREFDGKVDMKIEKGGVSGTLAEAEEIEIKANQESITINGEKDAQFSVAYKPGVGMEIVSFERNINVKYRGNEVALKDKKAFIDDKNGIKTSKNAFTDGKEARDPATTDPGDKPQPKPEGVDLQTAKPHSELAYEAPFPENNHVFLHTTGGHIPLFPKAQCIDGCSVEIILNKNSMLKQDFAKNSVPIIFLKIEPNIEAEITWSFRDGPEFVKGSFFVWKRNDESFSKALQQQYKIEVVN